MAKIIGQVINFQELVNKVKKCRYKSKSNFILNYTELK